VVRRAVRQDDRRREDARAEESGYFARAAAANADDLRLIKSCVDLAVECALRRESGVIGHDEDRRRHPARDRVSAHQGRQTARHRDSPGSGELLAAIGQPSRVGMLALIRPVITSTDGRCVARIR
jgi:hypothetical protein